MKLSLKGLALATGLLWGGCILLVGLANLMWPAYGAALLDLARSVYPGFAHTTGFWGVIVGTGYAFVDGVIGGLVFAWLYNLLGTSREEAAGEPST